MNVQHPITMTLLSLASVVIIIAGLMAAKAILIPILLAAFIAIIVSPLLFWLQNRGLHSTLALLIVLLMSLLAMFSLSMLVASSVSHFTHELPQYETQLNVQMHDFFLFLEKMGISLSKESFSQIFDSSRMMQFTSAIFQTFTALLTNSMMVMFLIIFMLLEAATFPKKLAAIHINVVDHANTFIVKVKQYMVFKTLFSFITGLLVSIMLWLLGVNYALLWGLLAFLLNYIPNIGSIIAAVPAILLSLIQLGSTTAIIVAVGFVMINIIIGSIVEPKYMGEALG